VSRPLNFLHLTTFYPPYSFGGDAMYIYRLAHILGDEGHHVDVIHCIDSYHLQHPAEPEIQFNEHPNVERHGLKSPYGWLSPLLTQQTGKPFLKGAEIQKILSSKPYDVMHFHNISLLGPEVMTLEPPLGKVVKIYTTHEHWLVCPTHVLWKFNQRACERPECLRCAIMAKRPPQLWRYMGMLKRTSRSIDQFVSPSRFTARMHAERGFSQPVAHLPYFIERADDDWRTPGPRPQETPYFLFVGRLEKIKGLHTLIPVWERTSGIDLLVAGSGTEAQALQEQAAGNPRIKFLGPLSQRELGNLYYHAVATVVPSITYETFGMIIIESYARKTPVIVRDLGALPEVVEESQGGFIYRTEDELIEAIDRLQKYPALRQELGERGYSAFLKNWCKEAHLQMYFDKLRSIALRKFGSVPWEDEDES
jgi:glycosyltransferase involved in cell wall biosynthesis